MQLRLAHFSLVQCDVDTEMLPMCSMSLSLEHQGKC